MIRKILIFVFLFYDYSVLFPQANLIGFGTILPSDESKYDNSFFEFYNGLLSAIERKDADYVYSIIYEKIQINEYAMSESNENSIEGFKIKYNLYNSNAEFWLVAKKLLYLGGKAKIGDTKQFIFPSLMYSEIYTKLFGENYYYDVYDHNINYGQTVYENVYAFSKPDTSTSIAGVLNYQIIKVQTEFVDSIFYKIILEDGRNYFIKKSDVYTKMWDFFMIFEKKDDGWKLIHFEITGL